MSYELTEAALKMRALFFFVHDLDEEYEHGDETARLIVDRHFAARYDIATPLETTGLVPLLQAKTLIMFLFPFVAAARSEHVGTLLAKVAGDNPYERWDVRVASTRTPSATLVLNITRHAMAHLFDAGFDGDSQGVNWDELTFTASVGVVSFQSDRGLAQFTADVIEAVRAAARQQLGSCLT